AHLCVFAVLAITLWVLIVIARDPSRVFLWRKLDVALALVLLWTFPAKVLSRYIGDVTMDPPLWPMQFCDWAAAAGFFTLILRSDRMAELTYFWAMAGTLQGLLTPTIEVGFPHPAWFAFFQLHGGVVLVALYLVFGHGWRPRKGAVIRVFAAANVYAVVAGLVNLLSVDNNYGFLRKKPDSGSMLDALGPWPIYLFWMELVALVVFVLFDMPFWRGRRRRARLEAAGQA
ncbi:MAG: TIGR02206 family membrane protein, partial [Verrucomicrobiales bacterium]